MMIDDDTLKHLLRINDNLFQGMQMAQREVSSRLIPLVDELTHVLLEAGRNKLP